MDLFVVKTERINYLCAVNVVRRLLKTNSFGFGRQNKRRIIAAQPTKRRRVDFESFCAQVARATTFTRQEVAAVLSYSAEIARDLVASGDIVEYGDLGTLKPSFKSKAVPKGEKFKPNVHIEKAMVKLSPSPKYFTLNDVSYEQVSKSKKKSKL